MEISLLFQRLTNTATTAINQDGQSHVGETKTRPSSYLEKWKPINSPQFSKLDRKPRFWKLRVMANNILGTQLASCSTSPLTGYFRDGCCHTYADDTVMHTICAVMTQEFLLFSKSRGNDLSTPQPHYHFPGLQAGDQWCLCLKRWIEALEHDCAPPIVLEATHASVTEFIDLPTLMAYRA